MSAHLDLDSLCDLLAGEGGPAQVGHVASCPTCSAALADLEQAQEPVRALLAALPPPDVPADLGARLDAALLRARDDDLTPAASASSGSALRTSGGGSGSAGGRHGSVAPRSHRSPSWLLGGAAAVVTVAAVAGVGLGISRSGGGSSDSTATSGLAAAPAGPAAAAGVPASSTGTDYGAGRAALAAALPALLRGGARAAVASVPAGGSAATDRLQRLHTPEGLADCLAGLADPSSGALPVALDYARYAGAPALVVVLPGTVPDRVEVFVVGADCRAGADDTLLFTELPRS